MDQWDDLLLSGGFAPRRVLLRGLELEQVSVVPAGAPHSIYQELWHAATVLKMSLDEGRVALESWPLTDHFPASPAPASLSVWNELVESFLADLERAVQLSHQPGWLDSREPVYPYSWRDSLEFLAVHTAYHMGRIVLLRQLLGSWPPAKA